MKIFDRSLPMKTCVYFLAFLFLSYLNIIVRDNVRLFIATGNEQWPRRSKNRKRKLMKASGNHNDCG